MSIGHSSFKLGLHKHAGQGSLMQLIRARQESREKEMNGFFDQLEEKYAKKPKQKSKAGGGESSSTRGKGKGTASSSTKKRRPKKT